MKNIICKIFGHKISAAEYYILEWEKGKPLFVRKRECKRCYKLLARGENEKKYDQAIRTMQNL